MNTTIRFSHVDVLMAGLDAGLTYEAAERAADSACPEYSTCHVATAVRAVSHELKLSDPSSKVKP